jgi:hypothetical protein
MCLCASYHLSLVASASYSTLGPWSRDSVAFLKHSDGCGVPTVRHFRHTAITAMNRRARHNKLQPCLPLTMYSMALLTTLLHGWLRHLAACPPETLSDKQTNKQTNIQYAMKQPPKTTDRCFLKHNLHPNFPLVASKIAVPRSGPWHSALRATGHAPEQHLPRSCSASPSS